MGAVFFLGFHLSKKNFRFRQVQYEESVKQGDVFDITSWNEMKNSKLLNNLFAQKAQFERDLQVAYYFIVLNRFVQLFSSYNDKKKA